MPSKKTTARLGAKGAKTVVRNPLLRKATMRAGVPSAKVGLKVGKVFARRKARSQVGRLAGVGRTMGSAGRTVGSAGRTVGSAGRTVGSAAIIYVPMAADVLGLSQPPKPRRRLPPFAAGLVLGAGTVYAVLRREPS